MARPKDTPPLASPKEAITVLFCLIDDAYRFLNPRADGYAPLRKLYFLSAGPRDVLVPAPLVEEARQVLEDTTGLGSYAP